MGALGSKGSKPPPLDNEDLKTVLAFGIREDHLKQIWHVFREVDKNCTNAWSVQDMYTAVEEPSLSIRSPMIGAIFFMADRCGEGSLDIADFIVSLCSFCALSREEVLQFLFVVLDRDRNGAITKDEITQFFSYVPVGSTGQRTPVFPVNNKNCLDKFRNGKWTRLEFDGLASLCDHFPYVAYPAYHTQEMYRSVLLGKTFWERFDAERMNSSNGTVKRVHVPIPGTNGRETLEVMRPKRCSMQDILDFSRRKTEVNRGRRVAVAATSASKSKLRKERDEQVARSPLLTMIRNPCCMYHVPLRQTGASETAAQDSPAQGGDGQARNDMQKAWAMANNTGGEDANADQGSDDDESSSGSYETDTDGEEEAS